MKREGESVVVGHRIAAAQIKIHLRLQLFPFSLGFKPLKPFIFSFSLPGIVNSKQMKTKP